MTETAQRFGNFEFHTWFIDEDANLVLQLDLVFLQTLVPLAANIEAMICQLRMWVSIPPALITTLGAL